MMKLALYFYALLFFLTTSFSQAQTCQSLLLSQNFSAYRITTKARKHILHGDIVQSGRPAISKLRGGMHTHKGYQAFLESRPDIAELHSFGIYTSTANNWTHFMNTENQVHYVVMPESAYTRPAIKKLLGADLSAKSGYLWKTLFPSYLSNNKIMALIQQALDKPGLVEARGWSTSINAVVQDGGNPPFTITVMVNNNTQEVETAYPAFNQKNNSPHSKNSLLAISKNAIVSFTIHEGTIAEIPYEKVLFETDQSLPAPEFISSNLKRLKDPNYWTSLSDDKKEILIGSLMTMRTSYNERNLGILDVYLTHIHNSSYKRGDIFRLYFVLLDQVMKDRHLDQDSKFDFLYRLIQAAFVNEFTYVIDVLWAKHLINSVIKYRSKLEDTSFFRIIEFIYKSPISWTTLVHTEEGQLSAKNHKSLAFSVLNDLYVQQAPFKEWMNSEHEAEQLAIVEDIYGGFRANWRSEFEFISLMHDLVKRKNDMQSTILFTKYVTEYVSSLAIRPYYLQRNMGSLFHEEINSGIVNGINSKFNWKNVRPRVNRGLRVLRALSPSFKTGSTLAMFDLFVARKVSMHLDLSFLKVILKNYFKFKHPLSLLKPIEDDSIFHIPGLITNSKGVINFTVVEGRRGFNRMVIRDEEQKED